MTSSGAEAEGGETGAIALERRGLRTLTREPASVWTISLMRWSLLISASI
jgi:hypothetical protein